ncbi:MAG: hypothetical protein Q7U88_11260 [Desulfocapsaceae bacterium]|nr:hypothetical protein [Desulfocapsaceae bacterium]
MSEYLPEPDSSEILIYQTEDGKIRLDVRLARETLWMSQSDMAKIFQCSADNISLHPKRIYDEGKVDPVATAEEFSVVRQEGARRVRRTLTFYNLDDVAKQLTKGQKSIRKKGGGK